MFITSLTNIIQLCLNKLFIEVCMVLKKKNSFMWSDFMVLSYYGIILMVEMTGSMFNLYFLNFS